MRRIVSLSLLLLLGWTGCDRATSLGGGEEEAVSGLQSIAALKACSRGEATTLRHEIAVQGVVTANDRYGEYVRQIVIEDATGGLVVGLEASELYRRFPVGTRLTIFCNGLTLCDYGGRPELIADPAGSYGTTGIAAEEFARYLRIAAEAGSRPRPAVRSLDELDAATVDTYVRLDGVHFLDAGAAWCDRDPLTGRTVSTEHPIADREGRTFVVRTPSTVRYADESVPAGEGSLYGIVGCFNGRFSLRIVDRGFDFGG